MGLKCITPPSGYPVTLAEAKAFLNLNHDGDDDLVENLIASSVVIAEAITRRRFVQAQYDATYSRFPARGPLELPLPPLVSIQGVYFLDTAGTEQELGSGAYTLDGFSLLAGLRPLYLADWPPTAHDPNAVRVRFTCGWPMDDSTSPPKWTGPENIKHWIKQRVATLYEMREALFAGQTVAEIPRSFVDGLLDPYIIPQVP